ncbi:MAG: DNA translocase FtsK 4TM domain-containing protein, partial [Parvibaculum sp.]
MQRVRSWLVNPLAFLPPSLRAFLARRAFEGLGVALVALGAFTLLSVLSWSIDDPSLNNATTRPPGNWMGLPGAYVAD